MTAVEIRQDQDQGQQEPQENRKQAVQWLIDHVLGWQHFRTWSELQERYFVEADSPGYPACYWNNSEHIWYVYDTHQGPARPFDPYASLDDAWLLVDRIQETDHHFLLAGILWWEMHTRGFCDAICEIARSAFAVRDDEKEEQG